MKYLILVVASLMLSGCALFQSSEPIDIEIAMQLVSNAKQIKDHATYATDILDKKRENDWDDIESMSLQMLLDANVALAEEALENAQKNNAAD